MNGTPRARRPDGRARWLDVVLVVGASLLLTALTLYLLQSLGWIHFTDRGRSLGRIPGFVYYHLRSSIFFFAGAFAVFALSLRKLVRRLREHEQPGEPPEGASRRERLSTVLNLDARSDMAITTFFGVGVIYTAIGMESALINALGGISNAQEAAQQGAWEILRRLVDGGLILALSTTIFGGVGGYLLRMLKHAVVGRRLTAALVEEDRQHEVLLQQVNDNVERIRLALRGPREVAWEREVGSSSRSGPS
jgi:hypothetical protein